MDESYLIETVALLRARVEQLENQLQVQREINAALVKYLDADLACTWKESAHELRHACKRALAS